MVLVGGQAIAFWLDRFAIDTQGLLVSQDGDVLGTLTQAQGIAKALSGTLIKPRQKSLTSLTAQIRFPRSHGKYSNIDFLHMLFTTRGLHNSVEFTGKVKQNSIEVQLHTGAKFQVMCPVDLLESRMHNALGLIDDKGPHVVTQLEWAVKILHCAFLAILSRQAEREIFETSEVERTLGNQLDVRIGKLVEQVFELGKRGAGKQVLSAYGIEVLDAIPCDAIEAQNPSTKQRLDIVRKYAARRVLLANPGANEVRPQPD